MPQPTNEQLEMWSLPPVSNGDFDHRGRLLEKVTNRINRQWRKRIDGYAGVILWEGPSKVDGEPIAVILTGPAGNGKTGPMTQVYILRQNENPTDALVTGQDRSICGDCFLRPQKTGGQNAGRTCYVQVYPYVLRVWQSYQAGRYIPLTDISGPTWAWLDGSDVRFGAYGDPGVVPTDVWGAMFERPLGKWTGYVNQWRDDWMDHELSRWFMASVIKPDEMEHALDLGYRYYRILAPQEDRVRGELHCPHDLSWNPRSKTRRSHKVRCIDCGLCDGRGNRSKSRGVVDRVHGTGADNLVTARAQSFKKQTALPILQE